MTILMSPIEQLLERSPEPHAILDAAGRYRYLNPAAREVVGVAYEDLLGTPSPFDDDRSVAVHGETRRTRLGWTAIEFTRIPITVDGHEEAVVRFEMVHERSARDRQLEALVAVAGILGEVDQLDQALHRLAAEIRTAMGFESCAVTLLEPDSSIRIAGTAGLPPEYAEILEASRKRGAPLLTVRALEQNRVIVDAEWREQALADDRWAPLHELVRTLKLGTLIAVPLRVRNPTGPDDVEGALTVFCRLDAVLTRDDLAFLRAMTDYAATAISNARMYRRLRRQAAQEERLRLSRELHDSVTQELFSLSLRTKAHARRLSQQAAGVEADELHEQTQRALDQMRTLIVRGRTVQIERGGLVAALRARCAELEAEGGPRILVRSEDAWADLSGELQDDVYHLTIEAVRNAIKHAGAAEIEVVLSRDHPFEGDLEVVIADDGHGFTPSRRRASAVGLDSMRERASAHRGTVTITSTPEGTIVRAVFARAVPSTSRVGSSEGRAR